MEARGLGQTWTDQGGTLVDRGGSGGQTRVRLGPCSRQGVWAQSLWHRGAGRHRVTVDQWEGRNLVCLSAAGGRSQLAPGSSGSAVLGVQHVNDPSWPRSNEITGRSQALHCTSYRWGQLLVQQTTTGPWRDCAPDCESSTSFSGTSRPSDAPSYRLLVFTLLFLLTAVSVRSQSGGRGTVRSSRFGRLHHAHGRACASGT